MWCSHFAVLESGIEILRMLKMDERFDLVVLGMRDVHRIVRTK